jgi:hypothetical protein
LYHGWARGDFGLRNAECGMRNAECGMRNSECGMRNAECGMKALGAGLPTPPKLVCQIVEQLSSPARAVRLGVPSLPSDWEQSLYDRASKL